MSKSSYPKGVQIGCKNKKCNSTDFVQFVNFEKRILISLCSKCGHKMFLVPLEDEEALLFEKDFLLQQLSKKV